MKTRLAITAMLLCSVAPVLFFGITRRVSYASEETGSRHGAEYRIGFIKVNAWEKPSWIENRARKLGIMSTHQTWVKVQDTRTRFITVSRGHERAPASYFIGSFETTPEEYPEEVLDAFVRAFLSANNDGREKLVRQFFSGSFSP